MSGIKLRGKINIKYFLSSIWSKFSAVILQVTSQPIEEAVQQKKFTAQPDWFRVGP